MVETMGGSYNFESRASISQKPHQVYTMTNEDIGDLVKIENKGREIKVSFLLQF